LCSNYFVPATHAQKQCSSVRNQSFAAVFRHQEVGRGDLVVALAELKRNNTEKALEWIQVSRELDPYCASMIRIAALLDQKLASQPPAPNKS
jgi:hypothetical protein